MKKEEANKLMMWLMGVFSNWKADKVITSIWMTELPDITAQVVMEIVRLIQKNQPSPFPPSIFQIKAKLDGDFNPKNNGKLIFNALWSKSCGGKIDPEMKELIKKPSVLKALKSIGDNYGQCLTKDKPWHEKRFVDVYEVIIEKKTFEDEQLAVCASKALQIEDIKKIKQILGTIGN